MLFRSQNDYTTVKKITQTNELSSTKIICDKCKKEFVLLQTHYVNEGVSITTHNNHDLDYVSMVCEVPNVTTKRLEKVEKHYCLDCWDDIRDTIFA